MSFIKLWLILFHHRISDTMRIKANNEPSRKVLQAAADGNLNCIRKAPLEVVKTARCSSGVYCFALDCSGFDWCSRTVSVKKIKSWYLHTNPLITSFSTVKVAQLFTGQLAQGTFMFWNTWYVTLQSYFQLIPLQQRKRKDGQLCIIPVEMDFSRRVAV